MFERITTILKMRWKMMFGGLSRKEKIRLRNEKKKADESRREEPERVSSPQAAKRRRPVVYMLDNAEGYEEEYDEEEGENIRDRVMGEIKSSRIMQILLVVMFFLAVVLLLVVPAYFRTRKATLALEMTSTLEVMPTLEMTSTLEITPTPAPSPTSTEQSRPSWLPEKEPREPPISKPTLSKPFGPTTILWWVLVVLIFLKLSIVRAERSRAKERSDYVMVVIATALFAINWFFVVPFANWIWKGTEPSLLETTSVQWAIPAIGLALAWGASKGGKKDWTAISVSIFLLGVVVLLADPVKWRLALAIMIVGGISQFYELARQKSWKAIIVGFLFPVIVVGCRNALSLAFAGASNAPPAPEGMNKALYTFWVTFQLDYGTALAYFLGISIALTLGNGIGNLFTASGESMSGKEDDEYGQRFFDWPKFDALILGLMISIIMWIGIGHL